MGKVVVTEYVSLDGVMEGPGGGEDYKHVGWTFGFDRGEEGDQFKLDETLGSDVLLLLGRVTYEGFAAAWPSMTGEFADKLNRMPKYVVSSTISHGSWNNTTVLSGDVRKVVVDLKRRIDGEVVVHGSAKLAQALVEDDLVDELRLMIFPIVLGTGKRLFGETTDKKRMQLVESRTLGDGITILTFRPAASPASGVRS